MARTVKNPAKDKPTPAPKTGQGKDEKSKRKRLPRSVRKHVRLAKAALRREHTEADAEKAIEQLVSRLRK